MLYCHLFKNRATCANAALIAMFVTSGAAAGGEEATIAPTLSRSWATAWSTRPTWPSCSVHGGRVRSDDAAGTDHDNRMQSLERDGHDHAADALRYMIVNLDRPIREVKVRGY